MRGFLNLVNDGAPKDGCALAEVVELRRACVLRRNIGSVDVSTCFDVECRRSVHRRLVLELHGLHCAPTQVNRNSGYASHRMPV